MRAERRVRGVLLDIDGTLVDSNVAHARAWHEALQQYGHEVSRDTLLSWIGKGGDKLLPELTGVLEDSDEGEAIGELRRSIFQEKFLPRLKALPSARELVARLRDEGLLVGVASSATKEEARALLDIAGVSELIHEIATASDAERSKPEPDIVQATLERLRVPADLALLVGDTPYDVEAGRRAGVRVVAVGTGGWKRRQMFGAVAYYEDLTELLASYEASPFRAPVPEPRPERRPTRPTPPRLSRTLSPSRSRGAQR